MLQANQAVCSCPIFRVQVNWMIKLFKPWPRANYLWVGEEVSLGFTARLTGWRASCVHEVGLEGCSLAEGAEGEREGWRAGELLGAGSAESLLTLQFFSKVSVSRLALYYPWSRKKRGVHTAHTHLCLSRCDAHFFPPMETCETLMYSFDSYMLHAVHTVNVSLSHTHCTALGEESLTFSWISIWKGGYSDAWPQWKCITRANILTLTSWRPLSFNTICSSTSCGFPCQHCMNVVYFGVSICQRTS